MVICHVVSIFKMKVDTMNPPTLLITDDDMAFRETLRDLFEPEGFRTVLAEDGLQACEIVQVQSVDLALLDMHMPPIDGLETIRRFRVIKPELPCILLSAALDEMIIQAAKEIFVFSVLAKPCSRKQVMSLVCGALDVKRAGPGM